jgi:hypothetical protein
VGSLRRRAVGPVSLAVLFLSGCTTAAPSADPTPSPSTSAASTVGPTATPKAIATATAPAAAGIGRWTATGSMATARGDFSATLLADGRVLVAGGGDDHTATGTAELYEPATGKWTRTGEMAVPRTRHTATLLRDGTVLVAGGYCPSPTRGCPSGFAGYDPSGVIADAEIYDPRTGKWTVTGPMHTARALHTATLLKDGRVLVAGAEHADTSFGWPEPFQAGILASAEVYDPSTRKWSTTGDMTIARSQQLAAILPNGKVLVAGGIGPVSATEHGLLASSELYDPSSGRWSPTGVLGTPRAYGGTATSLADGRVLLAGGDGPGDPALASAEVYDPASGIWKSTGSLITGRDLLSATLIGDGRVLAVGGFTCPGCPSGELLASVELYDESSQTWTAAGSMTEARFAATATLLRNGQVLVAGGVDAKGQLATAELFAVGG